MKHLIGIEAITALTGTLPTRFLECAVTAWPGVVVAVPLTIVLGDVSRLNDRLPCPAADIIDTLNKPRPIPMDEAESGLWPGPGSQFDAVRQLVAGSGHPGGWWVCASESMAKRIFTHDIGVRVGLANYLVDKRGAP